MFISEIPYVSEECGLPNTVNTLTGKSGAQHDVEIIHRWQNIVEHAAFVKFKTYIGLNGVTLMIKIEIHAV